MKKVIGGRTGRAVGFHKAASFPKPKTAPFIGTKKLGPIPTPKVKKAKAPGYFGKGYAF
jgi:hypothetical protein